MSKMVELGTVVKVHPSGIFETSTKAFVFGTFKTGDKLQLDSKTKKVSVKAKNKPENKDAENASGEE